MDQINNFNICHFFPSPESFLTFRLLCVLRAADLKGYRGVPNHLEFVLVQNKAIELLAGDAAVLSVIRLKWAVSVEQRKSKMEENVTENK